MFTGTCAAAAQVACDDDSGTGSNSQLNNVPVTAGTTYLVKIADYGGPNGGTLVFHTIYVAAVSGTVSDVTSAAAAPPPQEG
jgi:predicted RNA-binding protein with TRAM domain